MVVLGQAGLHQHRRQRHPHGQLHRMQDENPQVQAHQLRISQHHFEPAFLPCFDLRRLGRGDFEHHRNARQRHHPGQGKQAGQADVGVEQGRDDQ